MIFFKNNVLFGKYWEREKTERGRVRQIERKERKKERKKERSKKGNTDKKTWKNHI